MALSAAEESELSQLSGELGFSIPETQPQTGVVGQFLRPVVRGATEGVRKLLRVPVRALGTVLEDFGQVPMGFREEMLAAHNEEFDNPNLLTKVQPPAPPATTGQKVARVGGELGGAVAEMLLLRRAVPSLGIGAVGQNAAADAFAGAVMDEDRPERGAAEFGALSTVTGAIPGKGLGKALLRTAGQAAIPVVTDTVNDELGPETLHRAATFGIGGAAMEALPYAPAAVRGMRNLLRKAPEAEPAIAPKPSTRATAESVPQTEEDLHDMAFADEASALARNEEVPFIELPKAKDPALVYQGETQGQHNFRDEKTGSNFVVTGEPTPEAVAAAQARVHERYAGDVQATEADIDRILAEQAPKAPVAETAKLQGLMSLLRKPEKEPEPQSYTPKKDEPIIAFRLEDGRVVQDPHARIHAAADIPEIHAANKLEPGFVINGQFYPGSQAGRNNPNAILNRIKAKEGSPAAEEASPALRALQRNREAVQADYDAARATGDEQGAADALSALSVIDKKLSQSGQPPPRGKLKLRRRGSEEGALPLPLVSGLAGATTGYLSGDDQEDRLLRAGVLGAAFAGLPRAAGALKNLTSLKNQAAESRAGKRFKPGTLLARSFNAGNSKEIKLASEREKGITERYEAPISRAAKDVSMEERAAVAADPIHSKAVADYLTSGPALDTSPLKAAGVPANSIELVRRAKEAKVAYQRELVSAQSSTPPPPGGVSPADWEKLPASMKRAIVTNETLGTYQTRGYSIDLDPSNWTKDPAAYNATLAWLKARNPGVSDAVLRDDLDTYLTSRVSGDSKGFGSGNKISQSLYLHRKDLSDREWGMLGALAGNPAVPPTMQALLSRASAAKALTPLEQQQVALLAGSKALSPTEREFIRSVGKRTILPPEFRQLLGEVTDPIQKELLTVAKLSKSAGASRFINEISSYTRDNGLKAALTTEELEAARAAGHDVSEYVRLKPRDDSAASPGLGKLGERWVTADVARKLTDVGNQHRSTGEKIAEWTLYKPTSVAKQAVTVFNPATHGRQIAQTPLMMIAARVTPRGLGRSLRILNEIRQNPDHPMLRQAQEDHVFNANFSAQEISKQARDFQKPNTAGRRLGQAAMSPVKFLRKLYGAPDDLVRFSTYLTALERFKGDRNKAVDFMNRFTPNYGQVAPFVAGVRKLPVGAPFLSWTAEMLRISKNLAQDLLTGKNYRDRVWAAAGLSALAGGGYALSAGSKALLSKSERDEFEKSERLMKSYQRNQAKLVLGRNKAGGRDYVGLQSVTPAGDLVSFAQSLLRGDWDAVASENPLFGLRKNPVASAAIDIAQGEHGFTGDRLDTGTEKLRRAAEAFSPPVSPASLLALGTGGATPAAGLGFEDRKLKRLFANNGQYQDPRTGQIDTVGRALLRNIGFNKQSAKLQVLQRTAQADAQRQLSEAQRDYRREVQAGTPPKIARDQLLLRQQDVRRKFLHLIGDRQP